MPGDQSTEQQNVQGTNCPGDQMYGEPNVWRSKCPGDQMSGGPNVRGIGQLLLHGLMLLTTLYMKWKYVGTHVVYQNKHG